MSKKDFKANHWFVNDQVANNPSINFSNGAFKTMLADFNCKKAAQKSSLNSFFVPGWDGSSLVSHSSKQLKKSIEAIHLDVKEKFQSISNLNSRLKKALYDEFLNFADFKAINFTGINNHQDLWKEIQLKEESEHKQNLDQFLEIYTYRICIVYILKIRFVAVFLKHSQQNFDLKKIFYPNSFLTSVFRKGSSTELNSNALEQNIFSWYRPDELLKNTLVELFEISNELSITDIIKNVSTQSESILKKDSKYSHSLSHKNFGLFLNSLLINFPLWLSGEKVRFKPEAKTLDGDLDIISCRYIGDYLESMSLSHWVAQNSNKSIKWDQVLCPKFKSQSFDGGLYLEVINELQFLTFLAQIANQQGKKPINFITQVVQGNLINRKNSNVIQKTLFNDQKASTSTYDRVIVNITEYPKNNIQHFLLNKVMNASVSLKENGLIYLLSSKKIFVPSQKEKLESFLQKYNLEGLFNLSEIKGKGEVGSYLYIFSKNTSFNSAQENKKSFASFRVSGNLETFQEFEKITQLTHSFFAANLIDPPPLAQKELGGFTLEFFKDAIVNGRMVHASSKDSSKVTHPKFFNNLMKSCMAFDYFFSVNSVKESMNDFETSSLGLHTQSFAATHIAIVDQRNKAYTNIEIIKTSSYEAKLEEYGRSLCSYFEIIPKWPNTCIETLKVFLSSRIGKQLVDLTFSEQQKRAKANLSKLLIPNFIINQTQMPDHVEKGLDIFTLSAKEILSLHPTNLEQRFSQVISFILDSKLSQSYPGAVLSYISQFKRNIAINLDLFELSNKKSVLNFNNPILKAPLLLSKTSALYPNNQDVFVEFNTECPANMIHSALDNIKLIQEKVDGITRASLEVYAQDAKVLTLFSEVEMLQFLEFILANAKGATISQVLQAVKVPSLENLKNIIAAFNQMQIVLEKISQETSQSLESILNSVISN